MKWSSQDPPVLHAYRRAYHLDTPSSFKNPLSHAVLNQGIGRLSPTMARPKAKRRVHKDQVALVVRKNFNALGVTESDVIVDWLYKAKNQGMSRASSPITILTRLQTMSSESASHPNANDTAHHPLRVHLATPVAFLDTQFWHFSLLL
jgi:hypothetical protein